MAAPNFKKKKFEEQIKNETNQLLRVGLADKRLQFISVTRVELTPDYACATLFWDTYDASTRGDAKNAIDGVCKKIRTLLSKKLNVRHTPEISFKYDSQFEAEKSIDDILDNEKKLGRFSSEGESNN